MEWVFEGIGTLLVGLLLGAAGGGAVGWKLAVKRVKQNQRGGDGAKQIQVAGDVEYRNER